MAVETETATQTVPSADTTSIFDVKAPAPAKAPDGPCMRVLTIADYKGAAECLAAGFKDDRVCTYPLDTHDAAHWPASRRWALFVRMFECVVYAHILGGTALGAPAASGEAGAFDAVALWMPPGRNMDDWLTMLRSGLWRLQWAYTRQGRQRFYHEFLPVLNAAKAEVLAERNADSWYLVYLATRHEARGRGLARSLIRWGTQKADHEGRATYLESSHRGNVAYYQRMGFQVHRTVRLKEGPCDELDLMIREPGAAVV